MSRTNSKEVEILSLLRMAGAKGKTNKDLSMVALRYGGYLGNLYKKGYVIDKEDLGNGLFNYVLIKEPDENTVLVTQTAFEKLYNSISEKGVVSADQFMDLIDEVGVTIRHKAGTHQQKESGNKVG